MNCDNHLLPNFVLIVVGILIMRFAKTESMMLCGLAISSCGIFF